MTVPVDSLQLWLAAHCWAGGDSGNPTPQRVVRLKRPLSRPTGTVPESEGTSGCGESSKSSHGGDLSPAKRIKVQRVTFVYVIMPICRACLSLEYSLLDQ